MKNAFLKMQILNGETAIVNDAGNVVVKVKVNIFKRKDSLDQFNSIISRDITGLIMEFYETLFHKYNNSELKDLEDISECISTSLVKTPSLIINDLMVKHDLDTETAIIWMDSIRCSFLRPALNLVSRDMHKDSWDGFLNAYITSTTTLKMMDIAIKYALNLKHCQQINSKFQGLTSRTVVSILSKFYYDINLDNKNAFDTFLKVSITKSIDFILLSRGKDEQNAK